MLDCLELSKHTVVSLSLELSKNALPTSFVNLELSKHALELIRSSRPEHRAPSARARGVRCRSHPPAPAVHTVVRAPFSALFLSSPAWCVRRFGCFALVAAPGFAARPTTSFITKSGTPTPRGRTWTSTCHSTLSGVAMIQCDLVALVCGSSDMASF